MRRFAEEFGSDLRKQVLLRGSIAQACQATGINRQQFNKYLAGQILPNARNMQKICTYLGVTADQLLSGKFAAPAVPAPGSEVQSAIDIGQLQPAMEAVLGAARDKRMADILPNGHYDCYFPVRAASRMLVRWLLTLKSDHSGQSFTCRTYLPNQDGEGPASARARYQGAVLAGERDAYLIATSPMPLHQPGILAIGSLPVVGRNYFSGLAMTRRIEGPLAITTALHFRGPECPVRNALSGTGLVNLDDPALDPVIARLMQAAPAAGANWMQAVNAKNLQTG